MPRLVLSISCWQSCTFERNPFILSVFVSRFSFRPCIRVFSSFRCRNISAMYASLAHHWILTSSFASSHLSLVKNTFSSFCSSYTRANTLPRDNYRTSVWSNKTLCSPPISSHRDANMRLFSNLAFTKFIIRTTSSSTAARSAGCLGNKCLPVQKNSALR